MLSHDSQSHIRWDWPFYQTLLPLSCLFLPADHSALPFLANGRHPHPQNSLPFSAKVTAAINAHSKNSIFVLFSCGQKPKRENRWWLFSSCPRPLSAPFLFHISYFSQSSWLDYSCPRVPGTILTRRPALQALLIKWHTSTNVHITNTTTYNLAFHFTTSFGLFLATLILIYHFSSSMRSFV